ncbi:pirin family protein [Dongia sedimenti]|uniref:Pirin family protein n=1 Tax=Dongia sedimenti TaxID=3064282 RepID=A0ABU0YGV6_9PROT|nr:pirin family protein [Rhodospirillaceae bacterium R-7]
MGNLAEIETGGSAERRVVAVIRGVPTSDGAGVKLTRVIGQRALPDLDPFLMLDEFGSEKGADYIGGFPDHPHRGFETVTYMLDGRMRHGDNKGHSGLLVSGSVQWMTAGRGLVHSEMPEQEDGLMRGFQLWINLPAKDKMCEPRYQEYAPEKIPVAAPVAGVSVKVIAGEVAGIKGPIGGVATDPTYLDIALKPGATFSHRLPQDYNAFAYVFEGAAMIGVKELEKSQLAVLSQGDIFTVTADDQPARLILVAGKPLREPVVKYGPFVMNTPEEIHQAIADYQAGRL